MADKVVVKVSAPGKVILHGEHSVLYGKFAIAGSLGLRTSIVVKKIFASPFGTIDIDLPSVELKRTISIRSIETHIFKDKSQNSWRKPNAFDHENHLRKVDECLHECYPDIDTLKSVQKNSLRGLLYILSAIFDSADLHLASLDIKIISDLTVGAGTGSSASFAVCLAAALIQLLKLIKGKSDEQFNLEDKILISAWAFNCEKIMHGSPSGIDNATCTFGSLVGFRKGEEPSLPTFQINLRILLVDTRVSRETKGLVAKVASLRERNQSVVDSIMDACDHVANGAFEIMEKLSTNTDDTEANYQQLSELWNMNHCLLASLGVSHPSLEDIRASATKHGLACKLTGAGGGGYAIILIPPATQQSTVEELTKELETKGYAVKETQLGGQGVVLEYSHTNS